jgi:hypothetical protein
MPVYLLDGEVLLDGGLVAISEDCCCTPTGACCVGADCTIETEDDCTGMGGVYQGDDTTCDPNPCETPPSCSCGFDAFDLSGRRFLTYTRTITGNFSVHSVNSCPPPDGYDKTEIGNVSATFVAHYNPNDDPCVFITDLDVASSDRDGGLDSSDPCSHPTTVECFCPSSFPFHQCSGFTQADYCQCGVSEGSCSTTESATVRTTTCDLSDSCTVQTVVCSPPADYNCDVSGSYVVIETLSNECVPI